MRGGAYTSKQATIQVYKQLTDGLMAMSGIAEQGAETFLLKMPVVCQYVRKASRRMVCMEIQSVRL